MGDRGPFGLMHAEMHQRINYVFNTGFPLFQVYGSMIRRGPRIIATKSSNIAQLEGQCMDHGPSL